MFHTHTHQYVCRIQLGHLVRPTFQPVRLRESESGRSFGIRHGEHLLCHRLTFADVVFEGRWAEKGNACLRDQIPCNARGSARGGSWDVLDIEGVKVLQLGFNWRGSKGHNRWLSLTMPAGRTRQKMRSLLHTHINHLAYLGIAVDLWTKNLRVTFYDHTEL